MTDTEREVVKDWCRVVGLDEATIALLADAPPKSLNAEIFAACAIESKNEPQKEKPHA